MNVSLFRQEFQNFQLNTFDGTVFIVQNVNGCTEDLGGPDEDQSKFSGAANFNPAATAGPATRTMSAMASSRRASSSKRRYRVMRDLPRGQCRLTYARTKYRDDLVGTDEWRAAQPGASSAARPPHVECPGACRHGRGRLRRPSAASGLRGLFYVDARYSGKYNTGSDLFQKGQKGYTVVNARLGLRGPDEKWGIELWAQNLFKKDYQQVAFNSPFQEGARAPTAAFAIRSSRGERDLLGLYRRAAHLWPDFRALLAPRPLLLPNMSRRRAVSPLRRSAPCPDGSVIPVEATTRWSRRPARRRPPERG